LEYVSLGRSGLKISRICLGCMSFGTDPARPWILDEQASRPFFRRALDLGINFFDTADYYSRGTSEEFLGRTIQDLVPRHQAVIATKVYAPTGTDPNSRGLSRKHIFEAIDASLKRLGPDYVDLYQIHRWDYETPIEETLDALNDVVRSGRARYLGASSMYAWEFMKALGLQRQNGWAAFVSMQNHYNLVYREEEREMLPLCRSEGVGVIPWSPLARGFLARSSAANASASSRAQNDELAKEYYGSSQDHEILERVQRVAARRETTPAVVALAWLMRRPGVCAPIVGTSKISQLESAEEAIKVQLTDAEIAEIEAPYRPRPIVGQTVPASIVNANR
jgi:aryl-alcohol dehydrogenase-like predicted oxidoreductase